MLLTFTVWSLLKMYTSYAAVKTSPTCSLIHTQADFKFYCENAAVHSLWSVSSSVARYTYPSHHQRAFTTYHEREWEGHQGSRCTLIWGTSAVVSRRHVGCWRWWTSPKTSERWNKDTIRWLRMGKLFHIYIFFFFHLTFHITLGGLIHSLWCYSTWNDTLPHKRR
jgi:hypothetical protein